MKSIFTRRSIRKYKDKPISDEKIRKILKAGMAAPSAGNEQPWQFVVIKRDDIKADIMKYHNYASMLQTAPVAILVCGDKQLERHSGYWVQDCAAATQNMLLMIDSLGLGGVWLGVYPRQKRMDGIAQVLDIPDKVIPFSLIALGHPAEEKEPHNRYLEDRVHFENW